MKLLEACEPLLQYICRLNRSARKGVSLEVHQVRAEVEQLFNEVASRAAAAGLSEQYEKIRIPLVYFVDFMVKESELDFARDWKEMAADENLFGGDEAFWDELEETLADQSAAAKERLEVFYVMVGLGFTGFYTGQPEFLRKKMLEMSARFRPGARQTEAGKICPEAYEHVDTSDLIQPAGRSLIGIMVVLLVLVVVLVVGGSYLYLDGSREMRASLDTVSER